MRIERCAKAVIGKWQVKGEAHLSSRPPEDVSYNEASANSTDSE